jgi:uracil-DNA glycosylase family 4
MPVYGEGKRGILFIGTSPSDKDDESGVPFSPRGEAGRHLRQTLESFGVDLQEDCWSTNAMICKNPAKLDPATNQPKQPIQPKELEWCRANLTKTIKDLKPRVIIPMGFPAVKQLLVPLFRDDVGQMATWAGWEIPLQKLNTWVCPIVSPQNVVSAASDRNGKVVSLLWEKQLETALMHTKRPWDVFPDYAENVRLLLDPDEAVAWLDRIIRQGKPTAFDWETNCLKPDAAGAKLVSAGFHSAGETVAFLASGERIKNKLAEFCASDLPKIGANNKFEDRWARKHLGTPVKNWVWDCMLSAHHLDNRSGITSVKFQAFVLLGYEPWDAVVGKYLEAPDAVSLNQIHKVDTKSLLTYNALDAVVEFTIALKQKALMRWMNV